MVRRRRASTSPHDQLAVRRLKRGQGNLQPGDLVFFNNLDHVGLYVGWADPRPRTGKNVEVVSITSGYYLNTYYGAGHP